MKMSKTKRTTCEAQRGKNPVKHAKREIQKKKAVGSAHLAARLCAGGLDGKDGALGIFTLPQGRRGLVASPPERLIFTAGCAEKPCVPDEA